MLHEQRWPIFRLMRVNIVGLGSFGIGHPAHPSQFEQVHS